MAIRKKTCTRCGAPKPLKDYGRNPKTKDGLFHICTACLSAAGKARIEAPRMALKAPLSSFEDVVGDWELGTTEGRLDAFLADPTEDQKEAMFPLLLALAEERISDFQALLELVTTDDKSMVTLLAEMLMAVHGLTDAMSNESYKNYLRFQVRTS